MMNFLDWLGAAGSAVGSTPQGRLERQFGFRPEETRRAAEALGPAYLLGLQRLAGDVDAWTSLIRSLAPGSAPMGGAATPAFFGSDALARAVAGEAARHSGLPQDMLAAMMPTLSAMTVEAVMRMASPNARHPMPSDMFGSTAAEMLRRSANAVEAFSRPSAPAVLPFPAAAPFLDVFKLPWMTAAGASRRTPAAPKPPAASETTPDPVLPAAAFLAAFTKGLAAEKPAPPAAVSPPPETANPFALLVAAGQDAQADYVRRMSALFTAHPAAERPASPAQ